MAIASHHLANLKEMSESISPGTQKRPKFAYWSHNTSKLNLVLYKIHDALPAIAAALAGSPTTRTAYLITGPVAHYFDPPIVLPKQSHALHGSLRRIKGRVSAVFARDEGQKPLDSEREPEAKDEEDEKGSRLCGYRGQQMMLSYVLARSGGVLMPSKKSTVRSLLAHMRTVPTIERLQKMILEAWDAGVCTFARPTEAGRGQIVQKLKGTVGTPELVTVLTYLQIAYKFAPVPKAQSTMFPSDTPANETPAMAVLRSLYWYFKTGDACVCSACTGFDTTPNAQSHARRKVRRRERPPVYLQWDGHCVIVVGIERRIGREADLYASRNAIVEQRKGGTFVGTGWNLLVLDPSGLGGVASCEGVDGGDESERALMEHRLWCGREGEDEDKATMSRQRQSLHGCGWSVADIGEFEVVTLTAPRVHTM